jgi:hypothetical protein
MSEARRNRKRSEGKRPFDIEEVMPRLRAAVAPYPKAALFELAAEGYASVFEILVACIISIRTQLERKSIQTYTFWKCSFTYEANSQPPVPPLQQAIRVRSVGPSEERPLFCDSR